MKKLVTALYGVFSLVISIAQTTTELQETARNFMRQGDYANAIIVLNRAIEHDPQNILLAKDLALSQYYAGNYNKALETIKPVLEREEADDQAFQVAGNIYRQLGMNKDCEKMYRKALKRFPNSGALYNDLGELQWAQKNKEAIKSWEKGIEAEPSFSKNYYNASRYLINTTDYIWALLYAETFLNMEPFSNKTPEIKQLLLDGYKRLFMRADITKSSQDKNLFIQAFLTTMNKQSATMAGGVNAESLAMARTRFILDWYSSGTLPQYRLFDYQRQLLKEGLFDAYNQWIFGAVQNLGAYQNWCVIHNEECKNLYNFQKSRIYKVPEGQYYH